MKIDYLDLFKTKFGWDEANPILIIDPDAVLSFSVILQSFQMIRRRYPQIIQIFRMIHHDKFTQRDFLNCLRQLS